MPNKNSQKGKRFERKIVQFFLSIGFKSHRTYGSSGKAEGLPEEVDVVFEYSKNKNKHVQCKTQLKLPELYKPKNVDFQFVHESKGDTFVVMKIETFEKLILGKKL